MPAERHKSTNRRTGKNPTEKKKGKKEKEKLLKRCAQIEAKANGCRTKERELNTKGG